MRAVGRYLKDFAGGQAVDGMTVASARPPVRLSAGAGEG